VKHRHNDQISGSRFAFGIGLVIVVMAGALLWLSLPRLAVGLAMLPGNQIKAAYMGPLLDGRLDRISQEELQIWRSSRETALRWVPLSDAWADLSLISLLEVRNVADLRPRESHFRDARDAVIESLKLNPSNGFMWLRLAQIDAALGAEGKDVLYSVMRSIESAPYEPGAIYLRLALGFRYWDIASANEKSALREQISLMIPAAQWNDIERLGLRYPGRMEELREALKGNEEALRRLGAVQ
jgi:hypothetical protein